MLNLFLSILLIAVCTILGGFSGQGPKELRRWVIPFLFTLYAIYNIHNWWMLTIFSISGWLSLGYGIPSFNGPNGTMDDKGSAIGSFFYNMTKSEIISNILTRGVVGKLIALLIISVPIITHHWLSYVIGSWTIIAIWASVSWRDLKGVKVKIFGKEWDLPICDLICYGVTTLGFVLIIQGFFK
jgi:hypothetical protein